METEARVYFLVGDDLIGTGRFNCLNPYGVPWQIFCSTALLCPRCGNVWGRVVMEVPEKFRDRHTWMASRESCPDHLGGQFTSPNFRRIEDYHPDFAVLKWDFLIEMARMDRRNK